MFVNYNEYFYFIFLLFIIIILFIIMIFYFNLFLYVIIFLLLRQFNGNTKDLSVRIIYCTIVDQLTYFIF